MLLLLSLLIQSLVFILAVLESSKLSSHEEISICIPLMKYKFPLHWIDLCCFLTFRCLYSYQFIMNYLIEIFFISKLRYLNPLNILRCSLKIVLIRWLENTLDALISAGHFPEDLVILLRRVATLFNLRKYAIVWHGSLGWDCSLHVVMRQLIFAHFPGA